MTNSLTGILGNGPRDFTLTTRYRANVDSLRNYFKKHPQTVIATVTPEEAYLYRGDLTGLLLSKGIPTEDHYLIMRVNDMTSVHDVDSSLTTLLIPDGQVIGQFKKVYAQGLKK